MLDTGIRRRIMRWRSNHPGVASMPASLDHIDPDTPMGVNLVADGATFRVWAPNALAVYAIGDFNQRQCNDASLLSRDAQGHWRGFIAGVRDRQRYLFHVVG